ncbi:hypothetical protein [Burkholderia sp. LMU1-1-1.1]|uniref:hypothetical protein n=1 Tax=Burkholderia sp. LMU1-1-1.1 TaxID=3135266 RepID=UPI003416B7D0
MLNDPDIRNVEEITTGDFVSFELFDADLWRQFRISRTALTVLAGSDGTTPLASLEKNIERIKGVAFTAHKVEDGYTVLTSDHFA